MALRFNGSAVNTIKYSGKNLQPIKDWSKRTINGVTCYIKDGVGYLNGTSTAGSWQQTEIGTIILPAGTYTIYFWTNFVQTSDPQLLSKIGLGLRNSSYENLYPCNTNKYRTFTLTEQQTFNIVFWWQVKGMVFDNIWIKSMVRPGTYDPSTEYDQYGIDTTSANLINYKSISSPKFTDLGNNSFKLDWRGAVATVTLPYSSFKTNTQYSLTITKLSGAGYWAYQFYWNYTDNTSERFTNNQNVGNGTYSYTSSLNKTLSSITIVLNYEADFKDLMLNEGQPKSYVDNDVKMLKYNSNIVWCKPLTFTASASGVTGTYYKEATSEPTATTGTLSSGATIHYNDSLSIKYTSESKTSTSTTSPSNVKAPVLTNQYTGSYGVNVKNNNSFSVDVYCRVGNSGSYSKKATLSANKSTSLVGLTHTEHTTVYVYFKTSATKTISTTTKYYSCTSSGIHKTKTIETPLVTGDVATEIKAKAIDNVTITISNTDTSSPTTSTSSTTVQSATSQLTMHR